MFTETTPVGRQVFTTIDAQGRPTPLPQPEGLVM
jgi:hypothetical protein